LAFSKLLSLKYVQISDVSDSPHLSQRPFDASAASAVLGAPFGTSRQRQRPGSLAGSRAPAGGEPPPWALVKLMELVEVLAQRTPAAWHPMVLRFNKGLSGIRNP